MHTEERNQLRELLDGTGLHGTHQAHAMTYVPPFAERYGGSAVATRWPHRIVEVLDLRGASVKDLPWCSLASLVPVPGVGDLLFIAATSSWRPAAEAAREQQAVALSDPDARHRTAVPSIIAGDFNASPDAASIRYLTGLQSLAGRSVRYHDAWAVAGDGPGYTWSVDNDIGRAAIEQIVDQPEHPATDGLRLRRILGRPPASPLPSIAAGLAFDRPIGGIWPSDHFGVMVDVDIGANISSAARHGPARARPQSRPPSPWV